MATTVAMPQLGESVTEGTLAKWLKQPGDVVERYESIAEVVTDKVNAEIPSPIAGTMGEHLTKEGVIVAVGEPLCVIESSATEEAPQPVANVDVVAPAAIVAPTTAAADPTPVASVSDQPAASAPNVELSSARVVDTSDLHLTPIVRMLAKEHGVDLHHVHGSGIAGRITKRDVLDYVQSGSVPSKEEAEVPSVPVVSTPSGTPAPFVPSIQPPVAAVVGADQVVPLTNARRAIADHMVRSWHTSPHAWFLMEVDMSNVVSLRQRYKSMFQERYGVSLTYLPFVARSAISALQQFPSMNASWGEEGIIEHRSVHLGIAVALEASLIVPVIRNADQLSLTGFTTILADIAERARTNKLKIDEIQGGTFTLNNTGALGTVMAAPIINQPQAAILTMELIVKRPVVVAGDAIAIRPMMNICISFDHRLNDGLQASRFLAHIKHSLEHMDEDSVNV